MLTAFSFICIRKTLLKHYSTLTYFIFSHNFPSGINKKGESFETFSFRTQTRGRTGMEVNPLVFETSASTDSAIWALRMRGLFLDCGCKGTTFFFTSKHFPDFSSKKVIITSFITFIPIKIKKYSNLAETLKPNLS